MSGEDGRRDGLRGWLLPVIVVCAGAFALYWSAQNGLMRPVALKPLNWAGLAIMALGLAAAVAGGLLAAKRGGQAQLVRLLGVLACDVGTIMVICL